MREHLSIEAHKHRDKDKEAERLACARLPKGNLEVVHRDMLDYPTRFSDTEHRDHYLKLFYCDDKRLLRGARRAARRLGLV